MVVVVSDHCHQMIDILGRGLKKFWFRAMDYLTVMTANKRKGEIDIEQVIRDSFEFGLSKMMHCYKKHLIRCMTECISQIFVKSIREEVMDQCQARQTHLEISEQYIQIMPYELILLNSYPEMLTNEIQNSVYKWIHFFTMKEVRVVRRHKEETAIEQVVQKRERKDINEGGEAGKDIKRQLQLEREEQERKDKERQAAKLAKEMAKKGLQQGQQPIVEPTTTEEKKEGEKQLEIELESEKKPEEMNKAIDKMTDYLNSLLPSPSPFELFD